MRKVSRPPTIVATAFGVALSVQVITIALTLWPRSADNEFAAAPHYRLPEHRPADIDVAAIVRAHFFGIPPLDVRTNEPLPLTQQALVLTATISMRDPHQGFAIIGARPESARLIRGGASIAGGAILDQVYNDRVILRRDGNLETLKMRLTTAASDHGAIVPRRARAQPTQLGAGSVPADPSDSLVRADLRPVHMKAFMLIPVMSDRSKGARIGMPRDPDALRESGLEAGDIINAVNGRSVQGVAATAKLLQEADGATVTLTIERGGQSRTVQVGSIE